MSFETAPAFRVSTERTHLIRERGHEAASVPEYALDAVLEKLSEALRPGAKLSKEAIAEAVESGVAVAHGLADAHVCPACGHQWAEHVGRSGCLDCDGCFERRPATDRTDVLLGESRLRVTRCVHDGCIETAVRPIGTDYACENHKGGN